MSKRIHVISFDVPSPPDYGGVIDVYYKLLALKNAGFDVILHAFQYGRKSTVELNKICSEVYYYARHTSPSRLLNKLPYIVCSRESRLLQQRLSQDDYPVLMEGLHSTYLVHEGLINPERCIVRTHNIEHDYYRYLSRNAKPGFRKVYFTREADKLSDYESILKQVRGIAAISPADTSYFSKKFGSSAFYLPAFHPDKSVNSEPGSGTYALYHGNLSVAENHQAAMFLVEEIFNGNPLPLVIAGRHPKKELLQAAAKKNIMLYSDLNFSELGQLVRKAHTHVLPTFQQTGIRLKLLSALYNGRHVIASPAMCHNTGLESLCIEAESAGDFKKAINEVWQKPFTVDQIAKRKILLGSLFANDKNIKRLIVNLPL